METIMDLWVLWLAGMVIFGGLALWNQVKRIKTFFGAHQRVLSNSRLSSDVNNTRFPLLITEIGKGLSQGLGWLIIFWGACVTCAILLAISLIAYIVRSGAA